MKTMQLLVTSGLLAGVLAMAQEHNVFFEKRVEVEGPVAGMRIEAIGTPETVQFVSTEMALTGKPVKGAPFSAQAVTETTQTLADGNRIQRTSKSALYRDSEGRTRRESTLGGLGLLAPEDPPQMVFVDDPVAGVHYVLNVKARTAHKMEDKAVIEKRIAEQQMAEMKTAARTEQRLVIKRPDGDVLQYRSTGEAGKLAQQFQNESLGKQMMEGVEVEGTRTRITIPAGQIGNERPIEIVSERWFSPELKVVIMSRNSDPRMGETVYKLTNISRAEPPRTLFEVPADFSPAR